MSDHALTRTAIISETLATARTGFTPAIIGATGAGISLYAIPAILASASIPMSVLGIVLGFHSRMFSAVAAGALGIVCAVVALLNSETFWLVFAAVASSIGTG